MQLIGGLKVGPSALGDYSFYGNLFSRLPIEVTNTGDLTRYVAFDYLTEANDSITFLGIEVDTIEAIPDDMLAWNLEEDKLTVLEANGNENTVVWQSKLDWSWRTMSSSTCNRGLAGEFTTEIPAQWTGSNSPCSRFFSMTANCYVAPGKTGCDDAVELVDHDPAWPERFAEFSLWLRESLGEVAMEIEHFGSTAIPGMPAKPVIDVLVKVPSVPEAKRRAIPLFNTEEWEYWWYGNHATFVKRDGFMGKRTHHVHMMEDGAEFRKRLAFRDYLNKHPEDALRYAELKRKLAVCHRQDRETYTDAKTAFVNEITTKT